MNLRKSLSNFAGWNTKRKILVIESDDWGSIRTKNKTEYDSMIRKGLDLTASNFTKFDSLESEYDLNRLFNLLIDFKDHNGNHPVFTPMCIMANPDFKKIRENEFQEYFYEPFTKTSLRYSGSEKIKDLWLLGKQSNIFFPQFHGREHLNVRRWLNLLELKHEGALFSFDSESIGASIYKEEKIPSYLAAFDISCKTEIHELENILSSGLSLFNDILGYRAEYFIASNSPEPKELEFELKKNGINYLTRYKFQKYPKGDNKFHYELNWIGKYNRHGQLIITRNAGFEPSEKSNNDWVNCCINDIANAFYWNKPAVISTHRVNYISRLSQENADYGLKQLELLLKQVLKRWPDVEFMSTIQLGKLISSKG